MPNNSLSKPNIKSYEESLNEYRKGKITKEQFIRQIKEKEEFDKKEEDRKYREYKKNQTAHGVLDIATAAIPIGGGIKVGSKLAQGAIKKLTPYLGRKIAESTVKGGIQGAAVGGVHGVGSGIIDENNPIEKGIKEAGIGIIAGSTLGLASGKIVQKVDAQRIKNLPKKQTIKPIKKYYSDYERGIKIQNDKLGKIKLSSDAYTETLKQNLKLSDNVIGLSKDIKNSVYIGSELPRHKHTNYDIKIFHKLRGKNADYIIAENSRGEKYFYKVVDPEVMGSETPATKPTKDIIPNQKTKLNYIGGQKDITGSIERSEQIINVEALKSLENIEKDNRNNKENKIQSSFVDYDNFSINGKKYKDWTDREIKDFWEGFDKNTLGNPDKYPFDKLEKQEEKHNKNNNKSNKDKKDNKKEMMKKN